MECSTPIHLCFRGERGYLHGTDIYQYLVSLPDLTLPDAPISLTFHSRLGRQPDLVKNADGAESKNAPSFRGHVVTGHPSKTQTAFLMESDREITERHPCNEKDVTLDARVDVQQRTASLPQGACGTCIEQVVFLNKALHQAVFPGAGSWLFARLELSKPLPPADSSRLSLRMIQVLGQRFTRSEILWDGLRLGSLCFSLP